MVKKIFISLSIIATLIVTGCSGLLTEKSKTSYILGHNFANEIKKMNQIDPDSFFNGLEDFFNNITKDQNNVRDPFSYNKGLESGKYIKSFGVPIDLAAFKKGLNDNLDNKMALSKDDYRKYHDKLKQKYKKVREKQAQENSALGKKFLEENKKKAGVMVTPSGLQYRIIKAGVGRRPIATDKVKVHYSGTLIDGVEFDSSYKRGQPAEFPLNRVIKGWTEGVQLMNSGAKFEFVIPSELGYGSNDSGTIPGNSVLIFEVELLEIK